jgi:hypothetical protein
VSTLIEILSNGKLVIHYELVLVDNCVNCFTFSDFVKG